MSAYEAATAWRGESLAILQNTYLLYLLCLFIYYLTYYIKEGIKDNILEIIWKGVSLWGRYSLKQGNTLQMLKSRIKFYFLSPILLFWLCINKVIKGNIFWDFKNMSAYEEATAWTRGIPCKFSKTLIQLYLLCLFLYSLTSCIKEGIKGNLFGY